MKNQSDNSLIFRPRLIAVFYYYGRTKYTCAYIDMTNIEGHAGLRNRHLLTTQYMDWITLASSTAVRKLYHFSFSSVLVVFGSTRSSRSRLDYQTNQTRMTQVHRHHAGAVHQQWQTPSPPRRTRKRLHAPEDLALPNFELAP